MSSTGGALGLLFGSDIHHGRAHAGEAVPAGIGTTDVRLLQSGDRDSFIRLHIPVNFQRLKFKPSLANVGTVLNLVTDPDLNPVVLGHADKFLKSFKGRIINQPAAVLGSTRDKVATLLAGIDGLVVPSIARFRGRPALAAAAIAKAGIRFPAILRRTGHHDGRIEGLMADADAVMAVIDPSISYYLTEFVNGRSAEGLFHKIRIFFFGDQGVVRHRLVSDHWNVHAPDRKRVLVQHPEHIETECRYVEGGIAAMPPEVQRVLAEVRVRMPLDYFGIDFSIMPDGRLLLFEANATMMFFPVVAEPPFGYSAAVLTQGTAAFDAMLVGGGM